MVPLDAPELTRLVGLLGQYDLKSTVAKVAGLLTVPALQANTIRIETLVHLAVAHCRGRRKPGSTEIGHWLNRQLGNTLLASLEDPVEDVFITNVQTPEGNRLIFEGIWESNDYFAQIVIDTLNSSAAPQECQELLEPAFALLRLSDYIADQVGLRRWHIEPSAPKDKVSLPSGTQMLDRARAVRFTASELAALGIDRDLLSPFILRDEDKQVLASETTGHTSLERRPLVEFGDDLVLALPHAVSPAIRRYVINELLRMGYLPAFSNALAARQARQVESEGLQEIRTETESLAPPAPGGENPSLHSWLLKYDINKYLHVVLLHDRMDWLNSGGLSSFLVYEERLRAGLEQYLNEVADYCRSLPDFAEGMTLIIMGGLGRGFGLSFETWPDQWRLSVIRISDLLMLAREPDRPVTRYLKCIKQKEWAAREGVTFANVNGDYNFYCFWRELNYQLVPRDLRVNDHSMLSIGNDMVLFAREEVRNLADCHVTQATDGSYLTVMRIGKDSYFASMRDRPVYASLGHLQAGVLAGVVETARGPSWLLVKPRESNEQIRSFLFEIWHSFIELYDRLVFEFEAHYPGLLPDPIEIELDFSDVLLPEYYVEPELGIVFNEPRVTVDFDRRNASVVLPSDFLMHFQQPENLGERLVLRSIAKGLVSLHRAGQEDSKESILDALTSSVLRDAGMRVVHLFRMDHPVDYLLASQQQMPVYFPHEDFVFSKLKLSDGCTSARLGTSIESKSECNQFLHAVVDKIWIQIREQLQQLDRTSVIRAMIGVCEAVIQDRDHWRRTAQAVLALYAPSEDALNIAVEREAERNKVAIPARAILEMAICECPEKGGRQLSRWELDDLLAKAALLVEVAMDSDAIENDLVEPHVELHLNGEYTLDRNFHNTVLKPFSTAYLREEFEGAAGRYSESYRQPADSGRLPADEIFSADFIRAFPTEFGLTLNEALDGFAELIELAWELDSVIVGTTLGDIKTRLCADGGLSPGATQAFLHAFSIFHRPVWETPPRGFKQRDLYPWRFRRRLSAVARPLLAFGEQDEDTVIFGVGMLKVGTEYLFRRMERGQLPQEFFTTREMKQYIGAVNNERGHAFARSVAGQMGEVGWQTRNEVPMTELGGSAELGDIDVLAWKPSGDIRIVECKRLQLARTVAEVAEICRRFRGEARDELGKHVSRVSWIRNNPGSLQRIVEFLPDPTNIDDRLITNTHVPMMYLAALPIETDKIVPVKWTEEG